jgi:potassium-dependent mechanosensitive channel
MAARAVRARPAAWTGALWSFAVWLSAMPAATGAQQSPAPTAAATAAPTATAAPVPLPEIATRSDDLDVYLKQLEDRLAPTQEIATIDAELPKRSDRIRSLRTHTATLIAASPALHNVDELLDRWRGLQDELSDWGNTLTARETLLGQEMSGLDNLRSMWLATRDAAKAAGAPAELSERIKHTLAHIQETHQRIEAYQQALLLLQDRVVHEAANCREAIDQLNTYRSAAVGRLLVRDAEPIWSSERWTGGAEQATSRFTLGTATQVLLDYARSQLPRLPFQLAVFGVLVWLWRRARQRTARWLADDDTLAPVTAVFEHPICSALFLALLAATWIYPQPPIIFGKTVRIAATPLLLRVLDGLVDPPLLPGLFALGVFFIFDQLRSVLAAQPSIEELLLLFEILAGITVLAWMLRSGRIRRLRAARSARLIAVLERGAQLVLVLLALALLAGLLGFMQLARVVAGAVFGSGYAAMLLFAVQRFAQGMWAVALRSRLLRRSRMVQRHRAMLQRRGERALSWLAAALWIVAALSSAELYDAAYGGVRTVLGAPLIIGSFSISLGDLLAFAVTIWLSFLFSRFTRFVLDEDVYPRVQLARGLPYAFSTVLHYLMLLIGFLVAVEAAGLNLDRFALLAGAFGVGVGFGLQNVVNNFVSGLILLFERPIQVGDTIQIGQLSGEIRRIGIRSSTVRTNDGAEVIVPNGTLISDPVTNWTLSDRMRRIELSVAVVTGSDPEKVVETLRSVAASHPLVLGAPAPTGLFVGFGDSALKFALHAWTDRFEQWDTTRSELGILISKAFAESGISLK